MCKVLVVDDEALIRLQAVLTLEEIGITVYEAADGLNALEVLEQHPDIDLIVLDIEMPKLNGIATAREIRKRGLIPILYASGEDKAHAAADSLGAAAWLAKPYSGEMLIQRLKELGCCEHAW